MAYAVGLRQHGGQHRVTGQGRTGLAVQLERNGGPGRFGQAFQYCHDAGASLFAAIHAVQQQHGDRGQPDDQRGYGRHHRVDGFGGVHVHAHGQRDGRRRGNEHRHRQFIETVDEGQQPAARHARNDQRQRHLEEHRGAAGPQRQRGMFDGPVKADQRADHEPHDVRRDDHDVRGHQPREAACHAHQREKAQQSHAQHQMRDHQRRQEQAVQHVAPGKAVARDGNRRGPRQAHRDGGRQERQPQAVLEGLHEIGVVEHGAEPAQ
ncbi:hypothetical protein G6F22_015186 [Rhizopus arrhizus]|nr:hypothetical protein G6F22_015186 [Rhizopus arrhizus]